MSTNSTEKKFEIVPSLGEMIKTVYWFFAIIFTWQVWGWGWGLVSIVLPIFPLISLAEYLVRLVVH